MDLLQFISSMAGSLAWPLTAIGLVVFFRAELRRILDRPLRKAKVGSFEAEWDQQIEQTTVSIASTPETLEAPAQDQGSPRNKRLVSIAQDLPRMGVIEAYREVQEALIKRLQAAGLEPSNSSVRHLLNLAQKQAVISPQTARAIRGLILMRNLAVHGRDDDISPSKALEYIALTEPVLYALETDITTPE